MSNFNSEFKSETSSPIKWYGGKFYIASKIVAMMPPHTHYVEPYFGSGAVMFAKNPEGISEVANDINRELMNFWATMIHPPTFLRFKELCQSTPFSQELFDRVINLTKNRVITVGEADVIASWHFFIKCRMSRSGMMKSFAPLSRTRTRQGMNEQVSALISSVEGLDVVHRRIRRVVALKMKATDCLWQQDGKGTLFYLDPTYISETRMAEDVYEHEMTIDDHIDLLSVIKRLEGKVMISGYDHPIYNKTLDNWKRVEIKLPNSAAGGEKKRIMTEVIWCNFTPNAYQA